MGPKAAGAMADSLLNLEYTWTLFLKTELIGWLPG